MKKESFLSWVILIFACAVGFYVFGGSRDALAQPSSDLISRWAGDAASARIASDTNGDNQGTMTGGVSVVPGKIGKAFRFDGSSGRISMGNPANLNFGTGPFSLEAWLNWDGGGSGVNNIIRKSNYPAQGPGAGYWMRIGRDSKTMEFSVGATTGPEGQTLIIAPLSPGAWHHVVATRDGSGTAKLYVDGQSAGTVLRQAAKAESTSGSGFALGAWEDQRSEYFSGIINEVSVYHRALNASEVRSAYYESQIIYPVPELGNCRSRTECRAYCEQPEHSRACLAFVKEHHLLSPEEIERWEKFIDVASGGGPGGCKDEKECISYCGDAVHIVECTDFVARHDLVSGQELAEMQKIAKAVKAGAKLPGNCRNKTECISYCEDPDHSEECVAFLEKADMISHEDAEFIKKSHGKSPGDCARGARTAQEGKKACSAFCAKSAHQQTCMDFAVQVGLISADDAKELSGGGSLEDFNACLPHIDPKMLKCFDALGKDVFEKLKAGEVPDDLKDIKEMVAKMKEVRTCMNKGVDESFAGLPPDGLACLEKELGPNPLEQIKSGRMSCRDSSGVEQRIRACMIDKLSGQLDACLSVSCFEVAQCVNKLGGGRQGDQPQSDPAINGKMDAIKAKINSCTAEQIRGCLAKDCGEMMSCINALQGQGGEKKEKGESNLDPGLQQEITAKMTGCMGQKGGQGQQGGGGDQHGGGGA